jgi:hypothetical protein
MESHNVNEKISASPIALARKSHLRARSSLVRASIRARFSTEMGVELGANNERHLGILPLDISGHCIGGVW